MQLILYFCVKIRSNYWKGLIWQVVYHLDEPMQISLRLLWLARFFSNKFFKASSARTKTIEDYSDVG